MRPLGNLLIVCSVAFLPGCGESDDNPDAATGNFDLSGKVVFSSIGGGPALPDGVYALDLRGSTGTLRVLSVGGSDVRASQDGTRIVYEKISSQYSPDIYTLLLSGGAETDISNLSDAAEYDPDISSSGSLAVFSASFGDTSAAIIFCAATAHGSLVTVADSAGQPLFASCPRLSPDGSQIAYIHAALPGDRSALAFVALDGSGQRDAAACRPLVPPRWSPTGRFVAFAPPEGAPAGLSILDMQTGVVRGLVAGETVLDASGFAWTRTDDLYCFGHSTADSLLAIYRITSPLFHVPARLVGGFRGRCALLSSPDGKVMGVLGRRGNEGFSFYVMNPDGTMLTKIAQVGPSGEALYAGSAQWVK